MGAPRAEREVSLMSGTGVLRRSARDAMPCCSTPPSATRPTQT